jgi:hypothetical protein
MAVLYVVLASCAAGEASPASPTVEDITLAEVRPGRLLPGTEIHLWGANFPPEVVGPAYLNLEGTFGGEQVVLALPVEFIDYDEMRALWPGGMATGLPSDEGSFVGQATISVQSSFDGLEHDSPALAVSLEVRDLLVPRLDYIQNEVLFVNDPVALHGDGFLLGDDEGQTVAMIQGCFAEGGGPCVPIAPTEVVCEPVDPYDRTRLTFPFAPRIAGILPGDFVGTVHLQNRHGSFGTGATVDSGALDTHNSIVEPVIFSFSPTAASLGQFVDIEGGGFVGVPEGEPASPTMEVTTIELDGTFTYLGESTGNPATLTLIPEFVDGRLVRYVLDEVDELGGMIDLRSEAGTFVGSARPVVQYGSDTATGSSTQVTLGVNYVKQVIFVRFLPAYVESLRHFGLRAADSHVRDRIFDVVRRDYAGLNVEWRADEPTDYKLYSLVEIAGRDPNGLGLMGYDNTPGKDDGNLRLYDRIGGVNALTQEDGYPGYGGVFVESLFMFSQHPGTFAQPSEGADPAFDQIFDPFRPDLAGTPVTAADLAAGNVPALTDSSSCPAQSRPQQIACAIWVLGSMIGTITSHEVGHSLGLADPGGPSFHNSGDWPGALMDSGYARSFRERAELFGEGPGVFCRHNWDYLRRALPTTEPDPLPNRLDCY